MGPLGPLTEGPSSKSCSLVNKFDACRSGSGCSCCGEIEVGGEGVAMGSNVPNWSYSDTEKLRLDWMFCTGTEEIVSYTHRNVLPTFVDPDEEGFLVDDVRNCSHRTCGGHLKGNRNLQVISAFKVYDIICWM